MEERMSTLRRLDAAFVTPSGGKALSQPAVWVERSIRGEDSVSLTSEPSHPRRKA